MCLILVAWRCNARHPLVLAANRDEYHARRSAAAAFWRDDARVLAGRDLEGLGTWLGVTRSGRLAAVTNYRGGRDPAALESRGLLTARFLQGSASPADYLAVIAARGAAYSGFNLLVADGEELWWYSNRNGMPRRLEPGIYGLGNDLLDSDDVAAGKQRLQDAVARTPAVEPLFSVLAPARIVNGPYGTRCSSVLLAGPKSRWRFAERSFDEQGREQATVQFDFSLAPSG
jgi:uncharacterized protein with NRDE domain